MLENTQWEDGLPLAMHWSSQLKGCLWQQYSGQSEHAMARMMSVLKHASMSDYISLQFGAELQWSLLVVVMPLAPSVCEDCNPLELKTCPPKPHQKPLISSLFCQREKEVVLLRVEYVGPVWTAFPSLPGLPVWVSFLEENSCNSRLSTCCCITEDKPLFVPILLRAYFTCFAVVCAWLVFPICFHIFFVQWFTSAVASTICPSQASHQFSSFLTHSYVCMPSWSVVLTHPRIA